MFLVCLQLHASDKVGLEEEEYQKKKKRKTMSFLQAAQVNSDSGAAPWTEPPEWIDVEPTLGPKRGFCTAKKKHFLAGTQHPLFQASQTIHLYFFLGCSVSGHGLGPTRF